MLIDYIDFEHSRIVSNIKQQFVAAIRHHFQGYIDEELIIERLKSMSDSRVNT